MSDIRLSQEMRNWCSLNRPSSAEAYADRVAALESQNAELRTKLAEAEKREEDMRVAMVASVSNLRDLLANDKKRIRDLEAEVTRLRTALRRILSCRQRMGT